MIMIILYRHPMSIMYRHTDKSWWPLLARIMICAEQNM